MRIISDMNLTVSIHLKQFQHKVSESCSFSFQISFLFLWPEKIYLPMFISNSQSEWPLSEAQWLVLLTVPWSLYFFERFSEYTGLTKKNCLLEILYLTHWSRFQSQSFQTLCSKWNDVLATTLYCKIVQTELLFFSQVVDWVRWSRSLTEH